MEQAPLAPDGDAGDVKSPLVRWGYPLLGVLLVGLYARTVATGPTFSDGPEIVTGIVTLGVIHPTGYPLFTLVAHAFVKLLPLDVQPCIKVSLFNALCGAGAAVFTAHVARAFVRLLQPAPASGGNKAKERAGEKAGERAGEKAGEKRDGGDASRSSATVWGRLRETPLSDVAGLFAGALLGTSPLVWDQIRIPEVYPFHLFLAAWALYGVMRFEVTRRAGFLVMSGLAIGLGLAHHVTMVYMLPAAIVYVAVREPSLLYAPFVWPVAKVGRLFKKDFLAKAKISRAWLFPAVAVVGFLPAFFYAYLLWANSHSVGLTWGGVKDWDGLYFHMMGKQYTKFMAWKDIGTYLIRIGDVDDVADVLKSDEGDARGKADVADPPRNHRTDARKKGPKISEDEGEVFEAAEDGEVGDDADEQEAALPEAVFGGPDGPGAEEIDHRGATEQDGIPRLFPTVENVTCDDEQDVFPQGRQAPVNGHDREEKEQVGELVENHCERTSGQLCGVPCQINWKCGATTGSEGKKGVSLDRREERGRVTTLEKI